MQQLWYGIICCYWGQIFDLEFNECLQPFGQGRRQEAEGTYVDVMVYTRMECLLPCLAHDGSKPTDSFVTKNKIGVRDAQ